MKNNIFFSLLAVLLFVASSFAYTDASVSADNTKANATYVTTCAADVLTDAALPLCDMPPNADCCLQVDSDGNYTCEALATTVSCAIDVTYDEALQACNDANITVVIFRGNVQINYLPGQVIFQVPLCPPC